MVLRCLLPAEQICLKKKKKKKKSKRKMIASVPIKVKKDAFV